MNAAEYQNLINERDVLNHTTLNVTVKELSFQQEFELAEKIKQILANNQLPKPELHDKHFDTATNYYRVDLVQEDVEKITDIFFDLEKNHVSEDGEPTPTASFYASLADAWYRLT